MTCATCSLVYSAPFYAPLTSEERHALHVAGTTLDYFAERGKGNHEAETVQATLLAKCRNA